MEVSVYELKTGIKAKLRFKVYSENTGFGLRIKDNLKLRKFNT
jgi:hypothetical protein